MISIRQALALDNTSARVSIHYSQPASRGATCEVVLDICAKSTAFTNRFIHTDCWLAGWRGVERLPGNDFLVYDHRESHLHLSSDAS